MCIVKIFHILSVTLLQLTETKVLEFLACYQWDIDGLEPVVEGLSGLYQN